MVEIIRRTGSVCVFATDWPLCIKNTRTQSNNPRPQKHIPNVLLYHAKSDNCNAMLETNVSGNFHWYKCVHSSHRTEAEAKRLINSPEFTAWICNCFHLKIWDFVTHPCHNHCESYEMRNSYNYNRNLYIFHSKKAFETVVRTKAAILSRPQCVEFTIAMKEALMIWPHPRYIEILPDCR